MSTKTRPLLSLLWLLPLVALADTDPFVAAGNQALQNNKPEEALAQYQKAEDTLRNNPDLSFNKGGALYAQQKYKEAATEFLAATSSPDNLKRAAAYRHYGDALFRQQELKGAIQAYEQALTLHPEDTVAAHNLEVALSKQQEQQEQPQSQQSQDQEQPQSQPQSQSSQSQPQSQQSQENQQDQGQKDQQDPQDPQKGQGQEQKDQQDQKDQKEGQDSSAQNDQEGQAEKDKKEQQAQQQQNQEGQEPPPNEPQDKLLDALRAKEKSFLHAKQKGKGKAQPSVSKDW